MPTSRATVLLAALFFPLTLLAQESPSPGAPSQKPAPIVREASPGSQTPQPQGPVSNYDPAIFEKRIPTARLDFLKQLSGTPAKAIFKDKQFRHLMKLFVPDCMFHYGRDMSLDDVLEMVLDRSQSPAQLRDDRYLLIGGAAGPYLQGRGFLWLDLQEGIGLGGFYFHPTNGEPTPTVNVFSRQVKGTTALGLSELPPEFVTDMIAWTDSHGVPPVSTTYFLTGSNRKVLLEHDQDLCATGLPGDCQQANADAAEVDEVAAYFIDQTHHATNATAWMIGADQIAWIGVRDRTCNGMADPLGCRIRVTREHTRVITGRPPRPIRRH